MVKVTIDRIGGAMECMAQETSPIEAGDRPAGRVGSVEMRSRSRSRSSTGRNTRTHTHTHTHPDRRRATRGVGATARSLFLGLGLVSLVAGAIEGVAAEEHSRIPQPSYHYGASIEVSCMNRSIDTGEHISNEKNELQYIPFPICNETGRPLELRYGIEEELNCTIPFITDPFFHLLEFYIHNDAPLSCRIASRPPPHVHPGASSSTPAPPPQEYVPLIFALAGTLQLSHLHISTHLNILLHSTPKHHVHHHDSGVIDSGAAYSTSPLSHTTGPAALTKKLVIGDPLPLQFSVRWFPSPALPRENGKVEWAGMGGHFYASTFFYCLVSAGAGAVGSAVWLLGVVMPKRMKGRGLGGATPLGYGNGGGVGNGWGMGKRD